MPKSLRDIVSDSKVTSIGAAKNAFMSANNIPDERSLYNQYPDFDVKLGNEWSSARGGRGPSIGGTQSSGGGETKTSGTIVSNLVQGVGSLLKTQESQPGKYLPALQDQLIGVDDVMSTFLDKQGKLNSLQEIGQSIVTSAASKIQDYYTEQTTLLEEINSKAMLTGTLSKDFRETITSANPRLVQLGVSFQDLAESANKIVNDSGRFALVNQETLEKAGEVGKAYLGSMQDMVALYSDFEKVGIGAKDANLAIDRAGKRSMELGLQSKKVVSDIAQNMDKLNSYGFKNGIDGLSSMAKKAVEFRMSMQEVFTIADKVMNPEGALELAANLQVLGGAIGDFNDPLKMMYMATNNVEGLQDALIGAAGSLASYNSEQGKFEITGVNLRRAKEMAAQMGISYQELAKGAIAAAERSSAASDLIARGLTLKPEQTEFLTNIARMKDGKMTIDLGQSPDLQKYFGAQEVALDQLTDQQAKELLEYQDELKEKTTEDIARGQATSIENIKRDVNYIAILARNQAGKMGIQLAEEMGIGPTAQAKLAQTTKTESVAGGAVVENAIKNIGDNFVGGIKEIKGTFSGKNMDNENKDKKVGATTNNVSTLTKDDLKTAYVEAQNQLNVNQKSGNVTFSVVMDPANPGGYLNQQQTVTVGK